MLIHAVPKLYLPTNEYEVNLVDVVLVEAGLVLKNGIDVTVRRPYPNKNYQVVCRKIGQKAIVGMLIECSKFMPIFTVTTRWAVNADVIMTHSVEHIVLDQEFDAVTDSMILWYGSSGVLGNYQERWPECYANDSPVNVQPRMDLWAHQTSARSRTADIQDTYSDIGFVLHRTERFQVKTVERERLTGRRSLTDRLPTTQDAFRC